MKKRYAMLDGVIMGTHVYGGIKPGLESSGVICNTEEARTIRNAMSTLGCVLSPDNSVYCVVNSKNSKAKTAITVSLRQDKRRGNSWFLNVQGNPVSAITGDNTFGSLKIKTQIQWVFEEVLDLLESKGAEVSRLREEVYAGNVYIHSIAFAVYTKPLRSERALLQLINRWYMMYELRLKDGDKYKSLLKELGLKRAVGDEFEDSISLAIHSTTGSHKLMHLCVYSKAAEKRSRNLLDESSLEANDLDKRARLDLTISNYYLRTHWNLEQVTLRSLYSKVRQKYPDTGWQGAVKDLMDYALRRTCLLYMFTCPNPYLLDAKMVQRWEAGKQGRKWDYDLQQWADSVGLDLDISPEAHLLMKVGLVYDKIAERTDWKALFRTNSRKITKKMEQAIEDLMTSRLASNAQKLKLDFSGPKYN